MAKNYRIDKITLRAGRCCRRLSIVLFELLRFSPYLLHHSGLHVLGTTMNRTPCGIRWTKWKKRSFIFSHLRCRRHRCRRLSFSHFVGSILTLSNKYVFLPFYILTYNFRQEWEREREKQMRIPGREMKGCSDRKTTDRITVLGKLCRYVWENL